MHREVDLWRNGRKGMVEGGTEADRENLRRRCERHGGTHVEWQAEGAMAM